MTNVFEGLVAVVTGGASGIGAAIAQALHREGATVAVLDLNPELASPDFIRVAADVRDRGSVDRAVAAVVESAGGIDIVINNAGVSAIGTVEEVADEDWARVLDINVTGMARVAAAALPHLRRSSSPVIVNVCSMAAQNGFPRRALYGATKGAVLSLTYAMATDHVGEGIRVNAVSPGTVHTPFVENYLTQFEDARAETELLSNRQATGRMVTPDEVAHAVLYLASPLSASTTGTALEVDGGATHLRVRR